MSNNTMNITPASKLLLKYLALPNSIGGRGGAQRYFLLSQDIPYAEQLFEMGDAWVAEKKRLVESGENPSGSVPVIVATVDDDKEVFLPQHIASSRLLAKIHGKNSGNDYNDYVQDMVADEYQKWRTTWVDITFNADDEGKKAYREKDLPEELTKFTALYKNFKTHSVYMSVNPNNDKPLWGDAAIFGLVRDHIMTGHMTLDDLKAYPELLAMFEAYEKIPAVSEWIEAALAK